MTAQETLARVAECARARDAEGVADAIRAHADFRWVGVYDVGQTEVAIVAWSGGGPPAHPRFGRGRGLTSRAIAAGTSVVVGDVTADPDYLEAFGDTRSEAIVPVTLSGEVVGVIDVESSELDAFDAADRRFLEACGDAARPLWSR